MKRSLLVIQQCSYFSSFVCMLHQMLCSISTIYHIRTSDNTLCLGRLGLASLETISKAALNFLQVTHATGTSSLSANSFNTPVVLSDLGGGVAARTAGALLDVIGTTAASSAESVGLGVAQTKAARTLSALAHCYLCVYLRGERGRGNK